MTAITVIKRNLEGREVWRYVGEVLRLEKPVIRLEAAFNGKVTEFMGVTIQPGDRFVETYFTDRWYNIYEIFAKQGGARLGWYCNIARPAVLESDELLSFVDLALDLWVAVDGTQTVLDEDEFTLLELDPAERQRALEALEELKALAAREDRFLE
jgi:uncharacterized protein